MTLYKHVGAILFNIISTPYTVLILGSLLCPPPRMQFNLVCFTNDKTHSQWKELFFRGKPNRQTSRQEDLF